MAEEFHGAKAAVFIGMRMLVYQRDMDVVWPGCWDFPGGGREGNETPFECLSRELREEFGMEIGADTVVLRRRVPSMVDPAQVAWFFVIQLPAQAEAFIRLGSEGQRWALMLPQDVAELPDLVPALRSRFKLWLPQRGCAPI